MKPQRWQQIDRIFEAALEREKNEWAAFLDQACAGDEELRREVESLLRAHEQAGSFIEKLPPEDVENILKEPETQSLIGKQVGTYRILTLLGRGGMGEVYLAADKMGRRVALKLLVSHHSKGQQHVARFLQEARTVLALNHPNIVTIHDIGETDGSYYIASELIEGETLRRYLERGKVELHSALEIAIQAATALSYAHEKGIVHRDIKPENVMIRSDGYVKVLDFGIAKLTEEFVCPTSTDAPTRLKVQTAEGVLIGTASYMSPEQARGLPVDARTDIWSLGVMLYETLAGREPFSGGTSTEVLAQVLDREPPPLALYVKYPPAELQRIVNKVLMKKREERYQTIKDLLLDLKALKQELEFAAKLERSIPPQAEAGTRSPYEFAAQRSGERLSTSSDAGELVADRTHPSSSAEYIVSEIKRHKASVSVALAALVIALAVAGYFYFSRASKGPIDSLAVLPFTNTNGDPNTEYLSDGITESIISSLSQLSQVRVMARSTVFSYKGKDVDPRKVGNELGVRAVLTGRIIQQGDNLTIRTELVNASDGSELWGQQYNRKLSDALVIQEEIAKEISDNLRLKLSGAEQSRVTKHYTENPEAYQLYLKGRYYWNKRTLEGIAKGIAYFQQAIEKDPSYALAYAGLADCYVIPAGPLPPKEKMPKAKAAAIKALEIDDSLAEAHTSLGRVLATYDWDWAGAKKEFQRAIELNPRYAVAHEWYGGYWQALGRFDESIAEKKRALELDPLSPSINADVAGTFYYARQYDQAIGQFRKTLEMDPNFPLARTFLPAAYEQKGMYDEAIAGFQKAISLTGGFNRFLSMAGLGHVYAVSGRKGEAQKILNELNQMFGQEYVPASDIALIYAGLGENDLALAWLEKAYAEHSFNMAYLRVEPRWDGLRSDPRFADLVRRVGLAP